MAKVITIKPVTRIEGHASIAIELDEEGNVADARMQILSLRGFEQLVQGRPAEELPRIVNRICGICPWMHHLAAVKAVDGCFGVSPTPTGHLLRELCHALAFINDKILHFFFLAAPDFILGPESDYSVRNIMGIAKADPELARRVVQMRQLGQMLLDRFAGKAIHPVAGVSGGFAKPMTREEREDLLGGCQTLLDFAGFALDYGKEQVFGRYQEEIQELGVITTGFLGSVDDQGGLAVYDGRLRLMDPEGGITDFSAGEYRDHINEAVLPWSYAKAPYAASWGQGFSLDLDQPQGIYRANTLARLNVCDFIPTPRAQAALEEYRASFGPRPQYTLLYHYARLIELVYACERSLELLADEAILDPRVRAEVIPGKGQGVGCVEAPRGTLIHDYATDEQGCIVRANMIVGTTHNIAPMNMSVRQAASSLIRGGVYDESLLNRVEMAVRAYDP
ncbi:Ni/Fe hydrogenase subunit alpha [Desulfogranum mediterraneum]|uniref:Ni/Fe hydrogenase subunit alpha n=1 Tax=Desulfogranum mediterraneum TaxID=160661 RepID=UPI0004179CA4|nr:Ni/Fe hydrogenase subunit alpha [Desulfogranum mediterraneum]